MFLVSLKLQCCPHIYRRIQRTLGICLWNSSLIYKFVYKLPAAVNGLFEPVLLTHWLRPLVCALGLTGWLVVTDYFVVQVQQTVSSLSTDNNI